MYPVTCHTKFVGPGSTFVAIQGFKANGAQYISEAISRGATTIVVEQLACTEAIEQLCLAHSVRLEIVASARQELAQRAANALKKPATQLKVVGVTGTKGKSTTTYLIEHILRHSGLNTGLVGSIKNLIATRYKTTSPHTVQEIPATLTTPESDALQFFLAQCIQEQVSHVVLETSSHALSLNRVDCIEFDVVGFTNLHHDHMDFYPSMEHYFADKLKIFKQIKQGGSIVINIDNQWGRKAFDHAVRLPDVTVITFGQQPMAVQGQNHRHVQFSILDDMSGTVALEPDAPGVSKKIINCSTLFGEFNGYNLVMAWLICFKMNISPESIQQALNTFSGVPGRLQLHRLKNGALSIVDYAHNAASMSEILKLLRTKTKSLIVVFGCGGDRDPSRRPTMGAAAAQFADHIILTDDNPRTEDRMKIIQDILMGIPLIQHNIVTCLPDRAEAIKFAVQLAQPDSIVALLGKGHENYYVIGDQTLHFSDYEEICKY